MLESCAFVDVLAYFRVIFGSDISTVARADVAAARQVLTPVFAATIAGFRTGAGRVTSALVRLIFAIVLQVADKFFGNTVAVGAGKLRVRIARLRALRAESDVVLIRTILAIVVAIANLPTQNAPSVVALESIPTATFVLAFLWFLIRIVSTIVYSVTTTLQVNADVVVAFESLRRTVFSI